MRILARALTVSLLVGASMLTALPANAAQPVPIPRPTIGGIKQTYCPADGGMTLTATVQGGHTSVKIGDTVTFVVTMTAVVCELVNIDSSLPPIGGRTIGTPPLGGGLKGDGFRDIQVTIPAGQSLSHNVVGRAVQAGTWTYTVQADGYSFGTTDPGTAGGCFAGTLGNSSQGWLCPRSSQASVTITIAEPASPTPSPGSSTSKSGGAQGQAGGSGSVTGGGVAQATPSEGAAPSATPLGAFSGAVARAGVMSPALFIVLAILVAAIAALGIVLIRRGLARRPRDQPEVTSGP